MHLLSSGRCEHRRLLAKVKALATLDADLGCSSSYSIKYWPKRGTCWKTGVWRRFSCQQPLRGS